MPDPISPEPITATFLMGALADTDVLSSRAAIVANVVNERFRTDISPSA